jgi:hypothetical protein
MFPSSLDILAPSGKAETLFQVSKFPWKDIYCRREYWWWNPCSMDVSEDLLDYQK